MHLIGRIASLEGESEHRGRREKREGLRRSAEDRGFGRPGLAGGLWPRPTAKAFNVYWFLFNIPCPWRGRKHIKFIERDCSIYQASVKRHI